jgi:hypothetical protein
MKHTNKYAIQALKNEYAYYPRNEQHYNRQYRMIVDALEMVKDGNSPTVADLIGSFNVWEEAFKRKTDFINANGFEFLKELKKDYALSRYKPDHNRPRPNKGITPQLNRDKRELLINRLRIYSVDIHNRNSLIVPLPPDPDAP